MSEFPPIQPPQEKPSKDWLLEEQFVKIKKDLDAIASKMEVMFVQKIREGHKSFPQLVFHEILRTDYEVDNPIIFEKSFDELLAKLGFKNGVELEEDIRKRNDLPAIVKETIETSSPKDSDQKKDILIKPSPQNRQGLYGIERSLPTGDLD